MRLILDCDLEDAILAVRCAKSVTKDYPDSKECVTKFENGQVYFFKKTKTGASVRRVE